MSYRSDVKICLKKEDYNELKKQYNQLKSENPDNYCILDDGIVKVEERISNVCLEENDNHNIPIVILSWDNIKWYYGYEDIVFIENFIHDLNDKCADYSFIRLGESFEDVEILDCWDTGCCDILRLERYISIEGE